MIETISIVLLAASGILAVIGSVGLVRFPDFYTRTHAATVVGVGSFSLALVAIFIGTLWSDFSVKILAILLINLFANPTATHAIADAAYRIGIKPERLVLNELERAGRKGK
jgi:multicomponent Na+:H+ antiporter subunit G